MRADHLLISLLGLLIGFALIVVGSYFFLLPFMPALRESFETILRETQSFTIIGIILMLLGCLTLTALLLLTRRRYALIQMGSVAIQDRVIAGIVKECLQQFFPKGQVLCDVIFRRRRVEIIADLPSLTQGRHEPLLSEIEEKLTHVLEEQCGLKGPFVLNVSFMT